MNVIKDLQTQEQSCVEKYKKYGEQAKDQELKNLFGLKGTEEEVANWFMENYNLRMVVLTAGADYSTVYTPDEVSTLATPKVDVVDTVGAGDAFSAALVMSLLKGQTLREAHECAVKISAFVCSHKGAWPVYE